MADREINSEFDLGVVLRLLNKNWYWFALSILSFVALAYLYNRYATPKFLVKSQIQVLEEKGASPELAVFKELDFLTGKQNAIEDEISVLASRSNFIKVVTRNKFNLKYFEIGDIKDREIYKTQPVNLNFLVSDSILNESSTTFYIRLINDNNSFEFKVKKDDAFSRESFGKPVKTKIGEVIITPNLDHFDEYKISTLRISVQPVEEAAQSFKEIVKLSTIEDYSKVINLEIEYPNSIKAKDVLDGLVSVYNQNAIDDKSEIADRTYTFINERISDIASSLSNVDSSAQEFKTQRGITDIASQADVNVNLGAATQQELQNAEIELNIASGMKSMVDNQEQYDFLPSNIGLSDPSIANTTAQFNKLVQERNSLLKSSNERNPMIVNIDEQLNGLRKNLQASLNTVTNNLAISVNNLRARQSNINYRIYSAPTNQRALRDITRKQETIESLYLYLFQRREESQIALASSSPRSRIIDRAYLVDDDPVSPNRLKIYLAALGLGFLIPFGIIYARHSLDNKIRNKSMLEKVITDYPILAELPKIKSKKNEVVSHDDRSVLAESLRILRTNLDYLIKSGSGENNNVVLVTSSVAGEGKTFLSINLSKIIVNAGKKVLLIGADIRNPKMYQYFSENSLDTKKYKRNGPGLSEYLYDDTLGLEDILNQVKIQGTNMDIVYSGKILPNPSELLMRDRLHKLVSYASKIYDYVILDSAPLMLVTDSLLISPFVKHTIYVTRAGVSDMEVVKYPIRLQKEGKLNGLAFVVNDVKDGNLGYAGKYGYGYATNKRKWYHFKK